MSDVPYRRWLLLAAAAGALAMVLMEQTTVSVALPRIRHDLGATPLQLQWVVNAYLLALAATVAAGGRLGDTFGRSKAFLAGLALFAVASAACGAARGPGELIVARAVQGVGAALVQPACIVLVVNAFGQRRRGRAVGTVGGVGSAFMAAGPLLGGALTSYASWRWVFWANLPVAALAAVLLCLARPADAVQPGRRLDPPGLALLVAGTWAATFGVQQSHDWGWASPLTLAAVAAGAALLALFAATQSRAPDPLIDLRAFRDRAFTADALVLLGNQLVLMALVFFNALYLQDVLGFDPARAGAALLPLAVPMAVGIEAAGFLFDRFGVRVPAVVGCALAAAGIFWQAAALPGRDYALLAPGLVLYGLGRGLVFGPAFTDALNRVPAADRGQAYGMLFTLRQMGAALGMAALGSLVGRLEHDRLEAVAAGTGSPDAVPAILARSMADGFLAAGAVVAAALLVALLLMPRQEGMKAEGMRDEG